MSPGPRTSLPGFNKVDKGGHFAAWEQPALFSTGSARRSDHCAKLDDVQSEKRDMTDKNDVDRRRFLGTAAVGIAAQLAAGGVARAQPARTHQPQTLAL